jgi:hypothetical protein
MQKGNIIMSPSIHRCTKQGGLRLTIYHWKTNSKYQVYYKIKTSSNCAVLHIFHIGALYFWFSIPSVSKFKALRGSFLRMWKHLMVQRCFHQLNGPSAVQIENLSHVGLSFGPPLILGLCSWTMALKAAPFKLREAFGSRPSTTCWTL